MSFSGVAFVWSSLEISFDVFMETFSKEPSGHCFNFSHCRHRENMKEERGPGEG